MATPMHEYYAGSTKVFSAKSYFSLIRECFRPRKFPAIRYGWSEDKLPARWSWLLVSMDTVTRVLHMCAATLNCKFKETVPRWPGRDNHAAWYGSLWNHSCEQNRAMVPCPWETKLWKSIMKSLLLIAVADSEGFHGFPLKPLCWTMYTILICTYNNIIQQLWTLKKPPCLVLYSL